MRQLDKELEPLREEKKARAEANPLVTIERRKRRKRQIARIVTVLLALAVLFYVGSLYLASQQPPAGSVVEEPPLVDDTDDVETSVPTDGEETMVEDDAPVEGPSMEPEAESDEGAGQETVMPAEGGDAMEAPGDATESDATAPTGDGDPSPQASVQPVTEPDPVAVPETANGSALTGPEPSEPVDNEGRLVVEFSGDCWVEVQNSAGRTLVAELRRAGETLDVTGDGPLRVVLGAVSAVSRISYSGDPVALSERRARNNRMVLTLSD